MESRIATLMGHIEQCGDFVAFYQCIADSIGIVSAEEASRLSSADKTQGAPRSSERVNNVRCRKQCHSAQIRGRGRPPSKD